MNRILLAATGSGCGKTTVTCALLAAFATQGLDIAAFKCGPDYIDPMFHRAMGGASCRNLDPYFCGDERLRQLFLQSRGRDLSIIEGVMGYYDGVGFTEQCSSYTVAQALLAPVVLCVDTKGVGNSIEAVLQGFLHHRADSNIKGVIFNRASPMLYPKLRELARRIGLLPLGFLPPTPDAVIESRKLGLDTASGLSALADKRTLLGTLAQQHLDLEGILALAGSAPTFEAPPIILPVIGQGVRIAVSRDEAFCFLYPENIEVLQRMGCEIVYFSPMRDSTLPPDIKGLYLTGGYPELHLELLSGNTAMRQSIRSAIEGGLPTIAECGGFLYLHEAIEGKPMTGIIKGGCHETDRLVRFGYLTARAKSDTLLCKQGQSVRAHEFHYFESENNGGSFTAQKASGGPAWNCIHGSDTLHAGFPHLYFYSDTALAQSFVRKAADYGHRSHTGANHPR